MLTQSVEASFPLSPIQQGMLFNHLVGRTAPGHEAGGDVEQIVCRLREPLDVPTLIDAWRHVVARHQALRTSFRWADLDAPVQEVAPEVEWVLNQQDWRADGPERCEVKLADYLRADRRRGFELETPPLMRLALFQLADADYQLVWTFHHMILDGRSQSIVLEDVFSYYENLRIVRQQLRPPSFKTYIDWLSQQDRSTAKDYWTQLLRGVGRVPLGDQKQGSVNRVEPRYAEQETWLPESTTPALRCFAQQHQLTLNTLFQAAWGVLLCRMTSQASVLFGAARACRHNSVAGATEMVAAIMNVLPVRVDLPPDQTVLSCLQQVRTQQLAVRPYERTPLVEVHGYSEVPAGTSLFDSVLIYDHGDLNTQLRRLGGNWEHREFRLLEQTNYPLTVYGYGEDRFHLKILYDQTRFSESQIRRMLGHLSTLLTEMVASADSSVHSLDMLTPPERQQLASWNETNVPYEQDVCIHQLFERQVERTPDAIAIVFGEQALTYRELNAHANRVAAQLRELGVGPETCVGIAMDRSLDLVVGLLAILKAGGAYLPLDPTYPADRLAFMVEDAQVSVLLTQPHLENRLPAHQATVLAIDVRLVEPAELAASIPCESGVRADNLSYVIYTSGSTGKPKGVMVCHRNVVNFFAGMDERIPHEPPKTPFPIGSKSWLAVTSPSFDISVLEMFWTLTRGFQVVMYGGIHEHASAVNHRETAKGTIDFSLFYFASDEGEQKKSDKSLSEKGSDPLRRGQDTNEIDSPPKGQTPFRIGSKYHLLMEGAKFGDQHGFVAVWTPERHFHAFGGLYPNPAVAGAAIAAITSKVQIRAGSCVLPLHDPIRVAEEWSLVDNLSHGRVGISFASGWQPNDFVLMPENYEHRKQILDRDIDVVRRLWRGESIQRTNPLGADIEIRTLPRPIQPELPIWITASGNPETFRLAGAGGFHLLTHLLGQDIAELEEKIAIYRQAWQEHGHAGHGIVSLMLHTFVGDDDDHVRETVRQPMTEYLRSSVDLMKAAAWHWPALKQKADQAGKSPLEVFESQELSSEELNALLSFAFERYYQTSGLFGTPQTCLKLVQRLKQVDVDEIACLIDFGVPSDLVLAQLPKLRELKDLSQQNADGVAPSPTSSVAVNHDPAKDNSIAGLIDRHAITHLQCTPSMASMLWQDPESRAALSRIETWMIGGEAFPIALAKQLRDGFSGQIINMYGPTETTIWSSTYTIESVADSIPIGRPIANTQLHILDRHQQPVPIGSAGELWIGGDGVVRGYLGRSELTAEKFVDDPFASRPGAKLYRTGDLARFREDGNVEFLGRIDHQVKVRGHRIELGEIELAMQAHPAVREAVVVAREDIPGDQRIVGYMVLHADRVVTSTEIRQRLEQQLPDYMIPSAFVIMDALPLTPNLKVDRKALPAPDRLDAQSTKLYVPPENELQEKIAAIWQELLNVSRVGVNENFFDLGGHSLLSVQAHRRLGEVVEHRLSITDMFRYPTIQGLTEAIRQTSESNASEPVSSVGDTASRRAAARRAARVNQRRRPR